MAGKIELDLQLYADEESKPYLRDLTLELKGSAFNLRRFSGDVPWTSVTRRSVTAKETRRVPYPSLNMPGAILDAVQSLDTTPMTPVELDAAWRNTRNLLQFWADRVLNDQALFAISPVIDFQENRGIVGHQVLEFDFHNSGKPDATLGWDETFSDINWKVASIEPSMFDGRGLEVYSYEGDRIVISRMPADVSALDIAVCAACISTNEKAWMSLRVASILKSDELFGSIMDEDGEIMTDKITGEFILNLCRRANKIREGILSSKSGYYVDHTAPITLDELDI